MAERGKCSVAFVCDFFYPRAGGVEMHIWSVAQCLIRRGHKVIVITHRYGDRAGVRVMTNGLKVYYVPWQPFHEDNSFPTMILFLPLFRDIMIRENIQIVHGHGAASTLMNEGLLHAKTMGLKTCYTDHSLFGFSAIGGIHLNKVLRFNLSVADNAIAVSHVCRENLCLRTGLDPKDVFTIPNAVDCSQFIPRCQESEKHFEDLDFSLDPKVQSNLKRFIEINEDSVKIIYVGRLASRKGINFLCQVIHSILVAKVDESNPISFIIAGDGPMRIDLEQLIEKHSLQQNVILLGSIAYNQVRKVVVLGDIFLNCSLTESFGSAIIEAAACGLFIVATGVGGVPEILPPGMILHTEEPHSVADLLKCVRTGIQMVSADTEKRQFSAMEQHEFVKSMYNWRDIAARTEKVYAEMMKKPNLSLLQRVDVYWNKGGRGFSAFGGILLAILSFVLLKLMELWKPTESIERVPDFNLAELQKQSMTASEGSR